jgi:magnesium chelatase accessory protein
MAMRETHGGDKGHILPGLPTDWPNRELSHFERIGGFRWHYQRAGQGPRLLLLHGTAASTHSWRAMMPALSERFDVLAPDLPGQGFSQAPSSFRPSLENMVSALGGLLDHLGFSPDLAAGHSAGAAIAIRMTMAERIAPKGLVSLNGALLPFRGSRSRLFPFLAKLLFLNPFVPRFYAWGAADRARVKRLLEGSGSKLDEEGLDLYARLLRDHRHVSGALSMMANWDLAPLERGLPSLTLPLLLVVGEEDRAIPPSDAEQVAGKVRTAKILRLPGLGHLAHEERPREAVAILEAFAADCGLLTDGAAQESIRGDSLRRVL